MGDAELHLNVIQKKSGSYQWVKQHSLPMQDWVKHLQEYVTQNNLARTPCHVALGLNKYQLFQIDRPEVEEQEVAQAIQAVEAEEQSQVVEEATETEEETV